MANTNWYIVMDRVARFTVKGLFDDSLKCQLLQHRGYGKQAAVGCQILAMEVIGCSGRGRDISCLIPPSRPGEFHPEALTEPCVTISCHTARAIH